MKNKITGRSAFLALLKDEGVTHLFGNPGTTELPIMHALKDHPDLTYVMAMQESLVVAMADGFSRASGKLVACNVHVAPGLGNAMGSLYNASFTGTPLILTAGQQEQGHGLTEPVLYGPLVQMAEPLVKWAVEVTRLEDLPRIVRRAAKIATTPPTGPVFISLPGDILNAEAGIELGRSTRVDTRVKPSDESLQALTARILKAERPVIIVGDEIVKSDALQEAAQLAETLGCPAYQSSTPYGAHFLSESPCFMGALARIQKIARETLAPYDLIIALGGDPLRMSVYSEIDPLPDGLSIVQVGLVDCDLARNYGAEIALKADVKETLRALVPALKAAGGGALEARAKQGLAALASKNWTARRKPLVEQISKHAEHLADRSGLAGAAGGRGDARQCDPGRRGTDVVAADDRAAPASRPLRLSRAGLGRHRLGIAGVRRRQPRQSRAAGRVLLRRRQLDVFDPVAVDRGQPQAAADVRDRQQWRLPHHQAAAARLPRRRSLCRHGFHRSAGGFYGRGEIARAGGDTGHRSLAVEVRIVIRLQPPRREADRGGGEQFGELITRHCEVVG